MKTEHARHTPGPWEPIRLDSPDAKNCYDLYHLYKKSGTSQKVANIRVHGVGQKERDANARLIVEAPAMLEALQCLDGLGSIAFEDSAGYKACVYEAIQKARAILARIKEGE